MNEKLRSEIFKDFEQVILFVQKQNDMDTCCGAMAMLKLIQRIYPEKKFLICGLKGISKFLPELEKYRCKEEKEIDFEKKTIGFLSEVTTPRQLNNVETLASCDAIVSIDHHEEFPEDQQFSEVIKDKTIFRINDPSYSSVCEVIWDVIGQDWAITQEIGEIILKGIYFETRGFKSDSVNHRTFEIVGEICKLGVNVGEVTKSLNQRNLGNMRIFAATVSEAIDKRNLIVMNLNPSIAYHFSPEMFIKTRNGIKQKSLFTFVLNWALELINKKTYVLIHYSLFDPFNSNKKIIFVVPDPSNLVLQDLLKKKGFKRNRNRWSKVMPHSEFTEMMKLHLDTFTC